MSKAWSNGSTRAWRRVRAFVLERDDWICRLALIGCTYRATEVHHTRGRAMSGDDPQWLIAACKACNLRVGDPTRHTQSRPARHSSW